MAVQGHYLSDAHDLAMYWQNIAEEDIKYYRDWLTLETSDQSFLTMRFAAGRLETATNPAIGARIQECVRASVNYTNQLMINVDDRLRIVQDAVNEFHETVLDEILASNLMTVNFDDFTTSFIYRLNSKIDYIDFVLFENVYDHLLNMFWASFDKTNSLNNCFEAAEEVVDRALL